MSILKIIEVPDPRLKLKAKAVEAVDDSIRTLMNDMLETMYAAPGVGLAAPQVGVAKRIIVLDVSKDGEPKEPFKMVNPEIVWASPVRSSFEEGCLSVPKQYADVERPTEVRVRYLDENGHSREIHAQDILATVVQHEMDHLQGTLFIDHISRLKRDLLLRRLAKNRRAAAG